MRKYIGPLAIFGIYFLVKIIMFTQLSVAEGIVTEIGIARDTLYARNSHKYDTPYPIVSFTDRISGRPYTTTDDDPGSLFSTYHIGDKVQVCYKLSHPEDARLYSFFTYWLPISALCMMIIGSIVWLGLYYLMTKKYNNY